MIEGCMSEFELAPAELMLAVWFHDAIYDPRSETSERDSVILFSEYIDHAGELHCNIDVDSIRLAIQLTKDHKSALRKGSVYPEWILKFLEIDLCILGASETRYTGYAGQIRAEYTHLGIEEFKAGRTEFLRSYVDFNFKHLQNAHFLNTNKGLNIAAELERLG
jgi:predicted metal-dependent HD superfamily phosphohydrolase